jgi:hypothetical protein
LQIFYKGQNSGELLLELNFSRNGLVLPLSALDVIQIPSPAHDLDSWLSKNQRNNPTLEITFAKAKLFRNTQTITKMNPYLVI